MVGKGCTGGRGTKVQLGLGLGIGLVRVGVGYIDQCMNMVMDMVMVI